jgi:hypothetical protein
MKNKELLLLAITDLTESECEKFLNYLEAGRQKTLKTVEQQEPQLNEPEQACFISHVSGSFDVNDIKWVIYYGHTKDKRIFLDEEKSGLDYFLEDAFRGTKTLEIFKEIFWNRIRKLVENYR